MTAFNQLFGQKDELLPGMKLTLERTLSQSNSTRVAEMDERLETMQKELLKMENAKQGVEALADEIEAFREENQRLLLEDANLTGFRNRMDEFEIFLGEQTMAGVWQR